jgi:hypothetical protein
MLQIVGWVGGWVGGKIVIPMPEALSFAKSRRQKTLGWRADSNLRPKIIFACAICYVVNLVYT